MTARLDVQTRDGVMLLTIDNPAQRNALIPDVSRALTQALRAAENDPAVAAAVLTGAMGHIKRLINQSACPELASHLELERESFSDLLHAPEAREGIAAFLEKRPPKFPQVSCA